MYNTRLYFIILFYKGEGSCQKKFVTCYEEGLYFVFGHYEKFLTLCPQSVREERIGGWTVAQQFYHGLNASANLISTISGATVHNHNPEAGALDDAPDMLTETRQAAEFLENIKLGAAVMFNSLKYRDLFKKNEIVSQKFGRDLSSAVVLMLIASHLRYHLGCRDASLREKKLPPAWQGKSSNIFTTKIVQRIGVPGATSCPGSRREIRPPLSAVRIIPLETRPRIFLGGRLRSAQIILPRSSSG